MLELIDELTVKLMQLRRAIELIVDLRNEIQNLQNQVLLLKAEKTQNRLLIADLKEKLDRATSGAS